MWLLEFHACFSLLCIATFVGFKTVFKDVIIRNGWDISEKEAEITDWMIFFVPILNVYLIITLLYMIFEKNK